METAVVIDIIRDDLKNIMAEYCFEENNEETLSKIKESFTECLTKNGVNDFVLSEGKIVGNSFEIDVSVEVNEGEGYFYIPCRITTS